MIKVFLIFIFLSLTGFITIWLKQDPGNIDIEWQGWIIETSVPIIIALIGLLLFLIILSYLIIKKITSIPKTIKKSYKKNKNDKANSAIIKSFAAKYMGEIELAESFSKQAKFLNNTPLKLLLDSEINNFYANNNDSLDSLNKMLSHPETLLLSIKKLTSTYIQNGEIKNAIKIIKMSPKSKNTPKWFFYTSLKLNIIQRNWEEVINSIKHIKKYTNINNSELKFIKSRIFLFKAIEEYKNDNKKLDFNDINTSLKLDPSFPPAIVFKAKLLYQKNESLGLQYIKKSWKKYAHMDIVNFLIKFYESKPKSALLTLTKNLTKTNKYNFNNYFILAQVALSSEAWMTARQALKMIPEKDWTKNIYLMMAELEKKEHGNTNKFNYWYDKSKNAYLDYSWGCTSCSYTSTNWELICPTCSNLDSIKWQQFSTTKISNDKNISDRSNKINNINNTKKGIIGELNTGIDRN